ncbi:uncharacterized protein LOC143016852 [Genypterus blacodes]|uniref:uncharacterized protein LOC143016852 n=1 Tax=Genypterus blacodes TaxID=154954 RepID=UPI003F7780EC
MGSILQERAAQRGGDRFSSREREWRRRAPRSHSGPEAASGGKSSKMGRRQSQRKSLQPPNTPPSQDNTAEKKLQQRRRNKTNTTNRSNHSARGASKSPSGDRKEPKVQPAVQLGVCREQRPRGLRAGGHSAAPPRQLSGPSPSLSPDLVDRRSEQQQAVDLGAEEDSDTDLSESERRPLTPSDRVPPQLDLRPEVVHPEDSSSHRPRSRGHCRFLFPDFLPPPFNSWSLSQLAVFSNTEGRAPPGPRPVGPLERYLERLLQLEWLQIQTVQEESGKSTVADLIPGCHRSHTSTSTRLSCPKSILQCQRAFPFTLLSSVASHSALLSGCACAPCHVRYSACSVTGCGSTHNHIHQSRLGPLPERRDPLVLPKRSFSETRARSSDRSSAPRTQSFSSPVRGSSHLRRMQAVGNIRTPGRSLSTARDVSVRDWKDGRDRRDGVGSRGAGLDFRSGGGRRRSPSEQRSALEPRPSGSDKVRNVSECRGAEQRRAGRLTEQRRAARLTEQQIKPDAVAAIKDNLPASKHSSRTKQVEFVT